ncbi:NHL domain-containing protein [Pontibacter arcticus]|uniref:HYR domain-containing protein n=1 Tax=Pontibacter arcticus TaxID=2080288 RepID=A0A364RCT9_9BACT|nr:LamG-like jellyroll fold domain-containing protein [Pontibacter arcticus]RAU81966.1 hypothetical protein DP923_14905 [Pontibacter arcticus]
MALLPNPSLEKRENIRYGFFKSYLKQLVFYVAFLCTHIAAAQNISSVGGGGAGADGSPATGAAISPPYGVAVDASGNIYFAEYQAHKIRKISTDGIISTIAGTGVNGSTGDGGQAVNAQISGPIGITLDNSGNIYFAEYQSNKIRKISTSGIITTVAGNGTAGFSGDGGPATSASLYYPWSVAVDAAGNLLITYYQNNRIRKVATNGIISTFAGNGTAVSGGDGGPATSASFRNPTGISIGKSGAIYISEFGGHRIRKISTNGVISTVAGTGTAGFSGDGGPATSAAIASPYNLAVDGEENIYIADFSNHRIRKVTMAGTISTIAGSGTAGYEGDGGPAVNAKLNSPLDVAVDRNGHVFIADYANRRIRKVMNLPANELTFNGTNQYVVVPNNSALEFATGTVEMWVKPNWTAGSHGGANPSMISMRSNSGTRYSLHIGNDLNSIGLWNNSNSFYTPYTFVKGQWYHIAVVMKSVTTDYYVNGILIGSTNNTLRANGTGYDLKVGASELGTALGANELFEGAIDEVRIWNTLRSAAEIKENMNAPVAASSTGLVAYFPIDAGVTGPANAVPRLFKDYTSNALNGKLYNYYSSNASLSNLTVASGTFAPAFTSATLSYAVQLAQPATSVIITPTAQDPKATIKVNGTAVVSGNAIEVQLSRGMNSVEVLVTAEDGTINTYSLAIGENDTKAPVPSIANLPVITAECEATVKAPTANDETDGLITATTSDPVVYTTQGDYTITWKYTDKSGNASTQTQNVSIKDVTAPVIGKKVSKVAIIGGWGTEKMKSFLAAQGYVAITLTAVPNAADLATYDAVILMRTPGNDNLIEWVKKGGLLITEYDASMWTLNTAKLLNARHVSAGYVENSVVTFASTAKGAKLGKDLPNPYYEADRTDFFISFSDIGEGVEVLATRAGQAAILGGTSGSGYAMIIGYDWGDGFPETYSLTGQLLLNALTFGNSTPTNLAVSASTASCGAIVEYATPVANDNCSQATVTQTVGLPSGSVFPLGVTTNTFVAKDAAGNETTVSFTVTVTDNVKPTVLVNNFTIQLDAEGKASITPAMVNNGSIDNCTIPEDGYAIDKTSFDCLNVGTNEVILTVTDASGNSATKTAIVTVEDKTAPIAIAKNITVQLDANGAAVITPEMINNGSSDVCGNLTLSLSKATFNCSNVGTNTITLTVKDASNNEATTTAIVTVEDKIAPVAVAKNITVQLDAAGKASITPAMVNNGSTDNCSIDVNSFSIDKSSFDCSDLGKNEVILTVKDINGNEATATAIVTVEDNVAPVVTAQNLTIELDANGQATITANQLNNGSTDACGIKSVKASKTAFNCTNTGENQVILTVIDNSGNKATATVTVTVLDKIAPSITAPAAVVVNVDAGKNTASEVVLGTPVTVDNCSVAKVENDAPAIFPTGTTTVTWTVTDASGNTETATQLVTVRANIVSVAQLSMIKVPIRTPYTSVPLPASVEVTYTSNEKQLVSINWNKGNYNGMVAGPYTLTGELILANGTTNLDNKVATVVVEVQPNKAPTALAFSATTFKPEATANEVIGTLTTTDPDDTEFVYTFVNGDGDADNSLFEIRGNEVYLKSNNGLSGKVQFSIRVRSTDPYFNTIEKTFTLTKGKYGKTEDQLKIVNAFSPNGDGINDNWTIPELRFYNNVYIQIFDRSGVRVFETTDPETGWNGRSSNGQLLKGPYLYTVEVKDINWVKRGVVTILSK